MAEVKYDGMAKDVRTYGRQLSTEEVAAIAEGTPMAEVLYFGNDRGDSVVIDSTGQNHGTIVCGTPLKEIEPQVIERWPRPQLFEIDRDHPLADGMSEGY